ncbi:MAG TPA: sodium:proton antiporter [Ramlibacter sp.]|uniref:cation:proton antiporter n=1 Tax=Ramlibacter sp. TaxID=1917967 RepID=UPI002D7F433E|nr:sodium:proton antiporter [Ramlibacter sp.]HET8747964.1 sodium:proton antiporter [Ramlibacter sp.]
MTVFQGIGLLFTLVAIFGYFNHRFVRLPDTLGITAVGLLVSVLATSVEALFPDVQVVRKAQALAAQIDFTDVVFHGLLSLLLFAGALHVDLAKLRKHRLAVLLLATVGVLISTAVVGVGFYFVARTFGFDISLLWCLAFGALISPTDPIAVLSVLKSAGAAPAVESKITGEALFNDGTAVVAFLTLVSLAAGHSEFSAAAVSTALAREVVGGVLVGLAVGYGASFLLRDLESYAVEILISLAMATGGYSLAEVLHVSAPLAVVIMGLVLGNHGAAKHMTEKTREHLYDFWHLLDELLNLVLFGLIGLEVIALAFNVRDVWLGIAAVPVVLVARLASVGIPLTVLRRFREASPHSVKIMTWGGLRGGISIALALSLPAFEGRDMIIGVTYVVVIFSLLVQATTLGAVVRRLSLTEA